MTTTMHATEELQTHAELIYRERMRDAARAEDVWRDAARARGPLGHGVQQPDPVVGNLYAAAIRAAKLQHIAAVEAFGVVCDKCTDGDVVTGVSPASMFSPRETTFGRCPTCQGTGRRLPASEFTPV